MTKTRDNLQRLLERAIGEAIIFHTGQFDKAGREYIEHPLRVMKRMAHDDFDGRIVAVLHDVLEDTPCTLDDLLSMGLEQRHVNALNCLTRTIGVSDSEYYDRILGNDLALRVKLADIADNSDETRLTLLPIETAERLREKYRRAREVLGPNPRDKPQLRFTAEGYVDQTGHWRFIGSYATEPEAVQAAKFHRNEYRAVRVVTTIWWEGV